MELVNYLCNPDRENTHFTIWQQNINKSRICQHNLLSSTRLIEFKIDIVALQEPVISEFATIISIRDWRVIYPSTHIKDFSKTKSVILIHSNILTYSIQCLKKLIKCFVLLQCFDYISRTTKGMSMYLGLFESPSS